MKRTLLLSIAVCVCIAGSVSADTFGTGANQFTIDFVPISGDASGANGTDISQYSPSDPRYREFTDPGHDYRMGTYEVTNDQFAKFAANNPYWTGADVPSNAVSWYEAAQFVNWLNTSTGHQAAYKFSGTQGTSGYILEVWQSGDTGYDASNPYRNSNAYYFLPTEDEWVKAAYWNGTNLQTWATVGDVNPTQDGWNFYDHGYATDPIGPWDVGDGSMELNGTFDMMGNVWELMESPYFTGDYTSGSDRGLRGGSYYSYGVAEGLRSSDRYYGGPFSEFRHVGFRVASVPEPCSLVLLGLGGLALRYRKS